LFDNSHTNSINPIFRADTFDYYKTNTYKLHYFESGSGIRFVITSDPHVPSLQKELWKIYNDFYVEYVIKNPLYQLGDPINCPQFLHAVERYLMSLSFFNSDPNKPDVK
jgi:hypothetical protein